MADIGFKAGLTVNDGAANAHAAFPGGVVFTLPSREVGKAESTAHDQADFYRRWLPTLIDSGVLKGEINFLAAQYARLDGLLTSRASKEWKLTAPPTASTGSGVPQAFTFNGFVSKLDETPFEREGVLMIKFEVTVSGTWTITGGTA